MGIRQLIATFLSILLLAGGPTVEAVPELDSFSEMSTIEGANCGDLGREASVNCNDLQQSHCLLSAPHCSFTFVYGVVGGFPATLPKVRDLFTPSAVRTAYQSPIPEVLTPPPNLLS